ncbi:hypothetical protein [Crenalkalicoccus roseus]|uniref:hypothetical protein n=1 Tax=Crenalkalicoccus roseus TaxID=1485588 RepID=UPI001081FA80|nr:hypothetical protein [Crenalkalicoccus roseus]
MRQATGRITVVQEGRFRLQAENGRGLLFLLHHGAALEPQDLPALKHRRVRIRYEEGKDLIAGIARDVVLLEEPGRGA